MILFNKDYSIYLNIREFKVITGKTMNPLYNLLWRYAQGTLWAICQTIPYIMALEILMIEFLKEKGLLEEFHKWYKEHYKEFTNEYINILLQKAKEIGDQL